MSYNTQSVTDPPCGMYSVQTSQSKQFVPQLLHFIFNLKQIRKILFHSIPRSKMILLGIRFRFGKASFVNTLFDTSFLRSINHEHFGVRSVLFWLFIKCTGCFKTKSNFVFVINVTVPILLIPGWWIIYQTLINRWVLRENVLWLINDY